MKLAINMENRMTMEESQQIQEVLQKSPLFMDIEQEHFASIIDCLGGQIKSFAKDKLVFKSEFFPEKMAIILSGSIDFSIIQFDGKESLIKRLGVGDSAGEVFACCFKNLGIFEYRCISSTKVIFLDIPKACTAKIACTHQKKYKVMENMMKSIAEDNIFLNTKIFILSQKKLRDKLLTYLNIYADKNKNALAFNRQDLANFIGADRSAVSRELMRMQKDGIIEVAGENIKLC